MAVKLLVDKHIQVVFFFFHVDRDVDALSTNLDRNRVAVVLVLEVQSKVLLNPIELVGDEGKLNLGVAVTSDFGGALELDLSEELFQLKFFVGGRSKVIYNFVYFFEGILFFVCLWLGACIWVCGGS